jgi:hypothetical protein
MRKPTILASLESRPWAGSLLAALGITCLLPSALSLLLPLDLLDALWTLGDRRLLLALAALFVASASLARVALQRRQENDDLETTPLPSRAAPPSPGAHLR